MARSGDELINPVTAQRLRILRSTEETGGDLLEMEATFAPGGVAPPEHLHPLQEERFEVREGALRVRLAGEERTLGPGEALTIPAGTPHAMWNAESGAARVLWQTRPALRTERLFERLFELARQGRVNEQGVPRLLQLVVLVPAYRNEMRLTRPPRFVQRILFGVLGPLAVALGYRAEASPERPSPSRDGA